MTSQEDLAWGGQLADLLKEEINRHAMPREEFEASRSSGIIHMRARRRSAALRGEVPTFSNGTLLTSVHNMCLRLHVYLAIWAGASGAVTFIDLFDGPRKVRYECTSNSELESALCTIAEELGI